MKKTKENQWLTHTYHAAGVNRRHNCTKLHKISKNVNIFEFHDHNWDHHEKCIQLSTNMPSIGSLIREIVVEISEI